MAQLINKATLGELVEKDILEFLQRTNNTPEGVSPVLIFCSGLHKNFLKNIRYQAATYDLASFYIVDGKKKRVVVCRKESLSKEKREFVLNRKEEDSESVNSEQLYECTQKSAKSMKRRRRKICHFSALKNKKKNKNAGISDMVVSSGTPTRALNTEQVHEKAVSNNYYLADMDDLRMGQFEEHLESFVNLDSVRGSGTIESILCVKGSLVVNNIIQELLKKMHYSKEKGNILENSSKACITQISNSNDNKLDGNTKVISDYKITLLSDERDKKEPCDDGTPLYNEKDSDNSDDIISLYYDIDKEETKEIRISISEEKDVKDSDDTGFIYYEIDTGDNNYITPLFDQTDAENAGDDKVPVCNEIVQEANTINNTINTEIS